MAGERWQFTKSQLANTPSRKCGIDSDKELSYRQQAANLIQDMGQRLQVNQLCINTSIVYMHRFYVFQSFTRFHRNSIAPACLFLAAKVEEQPRKLEHVIKVAYLCLHRESPHLDTKSETYLELAQDLVVNENILLQTMGFEVTVDHPHIHVVNTCELVRATRDLAQTSYFLATNSLHLTTMSLQYKPPVVAIVCIYLACKWSGWEIPRSAENKDWFWYVDKEVTVELLEELSQEFLNILDKCPSRLKRKIMGCKAGMKEVKEESDDAPSEKKVKQESEETVSNSKSAPQPSTSAISQHDETAASTSADLIGYSPKASDLGALSMFDSPTKPQTPTKSAAESSGSLKREGSQVHVTSLKEYRERKEREKHERDSHPQKTAHVKQSELLKKTIKSEPQDQVGELSAHHSAVEKPRENIFSQFGPQIKLKLEPSDSQVKSKAISQDPPIKIKIEALSQLDKKLDRSASSQPNDGSEQKTHHRIKTESSSSSKVEHTHSDNMEGAKHYHVKTDHKSPKLHIKLGRQSPVSSVSSDKQMTSSPIKIKIKTSGLNKPEKSEHAKHEKHSKHEKRRSQQHSSTDNGTNHKGDLKLKISTANLTASSSVKVKSPVKVNDHSSKHKMKNSKDKHNLSRSELNQHSSHHSRVPGAGLDNSASSHRKRPHSPEKGKSYSSSTVKYPRTSDRSSGSSSSQVGPVDMDICTTPSDPFTNESIIGTAGFTASNGSGTNSPAMLVRSSSNNDLSQLKVHLEHLIEMQKSHIAANILSPQSGPTQPPPLPPPPPPPFSIMGKDINKTTLYPGQSMPDYPPLPPPPPSPPPPPPPL